MGSGSKRTVQHLDHVIAVLIDQVWCCMPCRSYGLRVRLPQGLRQVCDYHLTLAWLCVCHQGLSESMEQPPWPMTCPVIVCPAVTRIAVGCQACVAKDIKCRACCAWAARSNRGGTVSKLYRRKFHVTDHDAVRVQSRLWPVAARPHKQAPTLTGTPGQGSE